jgi:DNA repair protein RecO (recombination protein O)
VAAGGAVCPRCRPAGSVAPSPETFALLDALLHGEWAIADAASAPARRDTSGLVAAHLQWHLERQLRSLPLVERAT